MFNPDTFETIDGPSHYTLLYDWKYYGPRLHIRCTRTQRLLLIISRLACVLVRRILSSHSLRAGSMSERRFLLANKQRSDLSRLVGFPMAHQLDR